MKGQNSPKKLRNDILEVFFFLDETVFVKVAFFYFAQLSKKKNVSNNKQLHKGSEGLDPQYKTRHSICSEETQRTEVILHPTVHCLGTKCIYLIKL